MSTKEIKEKVSDVALVVLGLVGVVLLSFVFITLALHGGPDLVINSVR